MYAIQADEPFPQPKFAGDEYAARFDIIIASVRKKPRHKKRDVATHHLLPACTPKG